MTLKLDRKQLENLLPKDIIGERVFKVLKTSDQINLFSCWSSCLSWISVAFGIKYAQTTPLQNPFIISNSIVLIFIKF